MDEDICGVHLIFLVGCRCFTLPRFAWGAIRAHMSLYIDGCHCTWILPNFWWGADALCTPHLGVVGQVCSAPYSNI